MSTITIEILQRANAALRSALTHFQPQRTRCSAVQARDLFALRSEIRCAADCLRDLPATAAKGPALEKQVSEFRCNLEQLRQALPGFHSRLLAEHARLAAAHTHSVAASAWVQANKKTL
jgi:hypothetical protein